MDVVWSECVKDQDGAFSFSRKELCTKRLAQCGPDAIPPCHLRHRDPIPLTALRPPILDGDSRLRDVSEPAGASRLLRLTPGALQEVTKVIDDDIQLNLYVN